MASATADGCGASGDTESVFHSLPKELFLQVLSYLSFDEISRKRQVCKLFEDACSRQLNWGFQHVERQLSQIQREVRTKLPRRESERRNHSLARHADILSAIETRLSLLQITYSKYIESGYCCFIPGKVLDEMLRILRYVRLEPNPRRSHEVLQELRDISSMAMEHFDERILPGVKACMQAQGVTVLPGGFTVSIDERPVVVFNSANSSATQQGAASKDSQSGSPCPATVTTKQQKQGTLPGGCSCSSAISRLQANSGAHTASLRSVRLDLGALRNKLLDLERVCLRRERRAQRQELLIAEQARQLAQQHSLLAQLTSRITRLEKNADLSADTAVAEAGGTIAAGLREADRKPSISSKRRRDRAMDSGRVGQPEAKRAARSGTLSTSLSAIGAPQHEQPASLVAEHRVTVESRATTQQGYGHDSQHTSKQQTGRPGMRTRSRLLKPASSVSVAFGEPR